jgi:hypothetical protein
MNRGKGWDARQARSQPKMNAGALSENGGTHAAA